MIIDVEYLKTVKTVTSPAHHDDINKLNKEFNYTIMTHSNVTDEEDSDVSDSELLIPRNDSSSPLTVSVSVKVLDKHPKSSLKISLMKSDKSPRQLSPSKRAISYFVA